MKIIEGYGGKCECCGESRHAFLSLDHRFNDGAEELKRLRRFSKRKRGIGNGISSTAVWRHAIKMGFPKDRYRLLCYNCNVGRHRNHLNPGICPHEMERGVYVSIPLTYVKPTYVEPQMRLFGVSSVR